MKQFSFSSIKKSFTAFLALSAFLVFAVSCSDDDNKVNNGGGNGQGTALDVAWKGNLSTPINPFANSNDNPTVDPHDNIYILSGDMSSGLFSGYAIKAFDKNGNVLFDKKGHDIIPNSMQLPYYDNKLYFTTYDAVYCLSATDGEVMWVYNKPDSLHQVCPTIAVAGNKVLVAFERNTSKYSYMFALDPSSGAVLNQVPLTEDMNWFKIAAKGNTAYITSDFLWAVDLNTMEVKWKVALPDQDPDFGGDHFNIYTDLAIADNGNISFVYRRHNDLFETSLITYDPNGNVVWKKDYEDLERYITIDENGDIYVTQSSQLVKVSGSNGSKIWTKPAPQEFVGVYRALIHTNSGVMYSGDIFGIYGIDYSGSTKYFLEVSKFFDEGAGNLSNLTTLSNGKIVILSVEKDGGNGYIYCLNTNTGGLKNSGWPKWGGKLSNTFSR